MYPQLFWRRHFAFVTVFHCHAEVLRAFSYQIGTYLIGEGSIESGLREVGVLEKKIDSNEAW